MGQEQHTSAHGKKGSHFTAEQRIVLEWERTLEGTQSDKTGPPTQ